MIIKTEDYTVECTLNNKCKLLGSMRLPSPLSYDHPFSPIKAGIESATDVYEIDLTELLYLNSSGITALARLIIVARKEDKALIFLISKSVPWQNRSLLSLKNLWKKLSLKVV